MVSILYDDIVRYFKGLSMTGYKRQSDVDKLLFQAGIQELFYEDDSPFRSVFKEDEGVVTDRFQLREKKIVENALYKLFGCSCLLPYPKPIKTYKKAGTSTASKLYTVIFLNYDGTPFLTRENVQGGTLIADILPELEPERDGYNFDNWDTASAGTEVTSDLVISSNWSIKTYTISLYLNFEGVAEPVFVGSRTVNHNTLYSTANDQKEFTVFVHKGMFDSYGILGSMMSFKACSAGSSIRILQDESITYFFEPTTYTLTLLNITNSSGTGQNIVLTVAGGSSFDLNAYAATNITPYLEDGSSITWTLVRGNSSDLSFIDEDKVFYMNIVAKTYSITLLDYEDNVVYFKDSISYNTTVTFTAPALADITIGSSVAQHVGWTPNLFDANGNVLSGGGTAQVTVTDDLTYKAVFNPPIYTVNFYVDSDNVLSYDTTTYSTLTLPSDTPTKSGYVFQGWQDQSTGTVYTRGGATISSDMTLSAFFTKRPDLITLTPGTGIVSMSIQGGEQPVYGESCVILISKVAQARLRYIVTDNGVDVTSQVVNDTYTIADVEETHTIAASYDSVAYHGCCSYTQSTITVSDLDNPVYNGTKALDWLSVDTGGVLAKCYYFYPLTYGSLASIMDQEGDALLQEFQQSTLYFDGTTISSTETTGSIPYYLYIMKIGSFIETSDAFDLHFS